MPLKFRLTINCENAVFAPDGTDPIDAIPELVCILREIADKWDRQAPYHDGTYEVYQNAYNEHGDVVGYYRLKNESED